MTEKDESDLQWFLKTDELELSEDLDRVERVLENLADPIKFNMDTRLFLAIEKMRTLLQFLRVANDIA